MRKIFIVISGVVLISMLSFRMNDDPQKNNGDSNLPYQIATVDSKKLDGNNISTWFRNNGSYNRDPVTGNSGFEWPKGSDKFARYASGLVIGAVVGDDTLLAVAEYDYEYLPGYIDDNGNPQGKNDPAYIVYKIVEGDSTSSDYLNWPINQGAYLNQNGKPHLIGNQTMFYSYTDGYPEAHGNNSAGTAPLKAQILQMNWCFQDLYSQLNNIIYSEFRIINRSSSIWNNCYISIWTDDDVGGAADDTWGVDSNFNFTYSYNFGTNDPSYGTKPPAVGTLHLRGPVVPSINDTVKYYYPPGSNNLVVKAGYKELGLSSFSPYFNGNDPSNYKETYRLLKGFKKNGSNWINPITNNVTYFPYSGSGWISSGGGNTKSFESVGPLTINPGDTQTITIAQVINSGINNLISLVVLRLNAKYAKLLFDNNFDVKVTAPSPKISSYAPGNGKIYLSWNDSCERVTMKNKLSTGTYKFQGYNIYQIRPNNISPSANDTVLIKTFDIIDGVRDIRDSIYLNEYQSITYGVVQKGSDNGISRFIIIEKDTLSNREFINGTEYKFSVTAYYYDPLGGILTLPKVIESSIDKNIIKVIPQELTPGAQVSYQFGDTIYTDQKDLAVMPIVFRPFELTNASYTSTFGITDSVLSWTLTKTANGITSTLFQNVKDVNGTQDTAKIIDGFLLVHQVIRDSGIIRDPEDRIFDLSGKNFQTRQRAWIYDPPLNQWIEGPDTVAIYTAKLFTGRQFQSRSIGMTFPTLGTFRNLKTKIFAHGRYFAPGTGTNATLTGGPLRKIQIVFGQSSMAYRYATAINVLRTDTNLSQTPYAGMVSVPFSVFSVDELDSTNGAPRQLNVAFIDPDSSGTWDPDTTKLGKYQITYILSSTYSPDPSPVYTTKNLGISAPNTGFPAFDIMYAWVPRVKKSASGVPLNFTNGDKLTVSPYRVIRPDFVPGYPVKYSWSVQGTQVNNSAVNAAEIDKIKAFPNPYYGTSELEYDSGGEKFIYFSHLPLQYNIYIYTLDGVMVKRIDRNQSDPSNTLEKWDLKNSESVKVASGMYIVYVDCKDLGTKTLKIAVFTAK